MRRPKSRTSTQPRRKVRPSAKRKESGNTGTYMFDKATGKFVKVSGRVPGLSHSDGFGSSGGDGYSAGSSDESSGLGSSELSGDDD